MDDQDSQHGEEGLDLVPDPLGDDLAGGVFQAGDFVQVEMVETAHDRVDHALDFAVIDQVTLLGGHFAFNDYVEPK